MSEEGSEALDACVIALYRASREQGADAFEDAALDRLGELVPFDYAVWSRAGVEDGAVRLYSAHQLRMPPGAMEAQAAMGERDVLGAAAFAALGKTNNASPAADHTNDPVVVRDLLEAFDLRHFLTTCLVDPFTALITSVTLIRGAASRGFTEAERQAKERVTPHLVEALTANRLLRLLDWRGGAEPYPYAVAICDDQGLIEFASRQFVELVRAEWPSWTGPRLPAQLRFSAKAPTRQVLSAVTVRGEPSTGRAVSVRIRPRQPVDDLSAREAEIARHSGLGRSNKEIAQELALSPFTVRNHLDSVYRKLGVSKRSELGALMSEFS
ncbi:MAG: response regulator transcription factor [Phenylobacterium sp.]